MRWFTSDLHFNHKNIVGPDVSSWERGYRDFESVGHMNETILNSINDVVEENDELWILGDFAFGDKTMIPTLRHNIKCKNVHLIYGNHDQAIENNESYQKLFSSVGYYKEIYIGDGSVNDKGRFNKMRAILCHYSFRVWNKSHHGSCMLYGHSHGSLPAHGGRTMDIGWCVHRRPLSAIELYQTMNSWPISVVDHHDENTN